jgi:hypothetical protein
MKDACPAVATCAVVIATGVRSEYVGIDARRVDAPRVGARSSDRADESRPYGCVHVRENYPWSHTDSSSRERRWCHSLSCVAVDWPPPPLSPPRPPPPPPPPPPVGSIVRAILAVAIRPSSMSFDNLALCVTARSSKLASQADMGVGAI